nr:MAG TPA: hypothetical protein [Caudoviricetes sp.]
MACLPTPQCSILKLNSVFYQLLYLRDFLLHPDKLILILNLHLHLGKLQHQTKF